MQIKFFHSSVTLTKGFGCFWNTFGGVKGAPGTQKGGGNPLIGISMHSTPQKILSEYCALFKKVNVNGYSLQVKDSHQFRSLLPDQSFLWNHSAINKAALQQ